jgi:hypothetical protein
VAFQIGCLTVFICLSAVEALSRFSCRQLSARDAVVLHRAQRASAASSRDSVNKYTEFEAQHPVTGLSAASPWACSKCAAVEARDMRFTSAQPASSSLDHRTTSSNRRISLFVGLDRIDEAVRPEIDRKIALKAQCTQKNRIPSCAKQGPATFAAFSRTVMNRVVDDPRDRVTSTSGTIHPGAGSRRRPAPSSRAPECRAPAR